MKRYLTILFAVIIALFATAAPAAAAGELGISSDGVSYSPTFNGPLFSSAIRWVPGDSRTATFYVRNQSPNLASLAVTVLGDHVGDLIDSGDITVDASGGGGVSSSVSTGDEQLILIASDISAGQVVPVNITVDFAESSPNETQLRSTDLNFRVTLTQSSLTPPDNGGGNGTDGNGGNGGGNGGDGNGSSGLLPNTGAPDITWIVVLGAILFGTGLAIVSRRRHNPQGESHV